MIIIVLKDTTVKGYYEEPIDDGCLNIGSYTRDIAATWKRGRCFSIKKLHEGKIKIIEYDSPYGVSMHSSTAYWFLDVKNLISNGAAAIVKDAPLYEQYSSMRMKIEDVLSEINELKEQMFLEEQNAEYVLEESASKSFLSKEEYNITSQEISDANYHYFKAMIEKNRLQNQAADMKDDCEILIRKMCI